MPKVLSFASWNVENFSGKDTRVPRVVDTLALRDPDLFAIFEVKSSKVFKALKNKMPGHNFFITENTSDVDMEILVGFRRSLNVFVTKREIFRSKVPTLRPGALANVTIGGDEYGFLFLHTKSFADPRSWGLRDDMFKHAASLKRKLDKNFPSGNGSKFLCLGDLNTMGLNAAYNEKSDLSADEEINSLSKRMSRVGMRRLTKTHELSWWNGKRKYEPGSKLDHVYADNDLKFKTFDGGAEIEVIGWPQFTKRKDKLDWINKYSDHAMLYGEIHS